jgi:hypothetical protein
MFSYGGIHTGRPRQGINMPNRLDTIYRTLLRMADELAVEAIRASAAIGVTHGWDAPAISIAIWMSIARTAISRALRA